MRRFPGILGSFVLIAATYSHALSSDPRLLSLVSPHARLVAGMDSPPPKGLSGSFVLMTRNNKVDLGDVLALTGADSTLSIQHAIFVANNDLAGYLNEHSLLMSGRFDQARIYKSVTEGGGRPVAYRGLSVLVIEPFARERGRMDDVRWLAVPGPDTLLFGSVASVREELDRYLDHDAADRSLEAKLSHLRRDDETWTVVLTPARNPEIERVLTALDPTLGRLAGSADAFLFGIRYRRQVELEYEAMTAGDVVAPAPTLVAPVRGAMLLPSPKSADAAGVARGVVKIATSRFAAWLEKVPSD